MQLGPLVGTRCKEELRALIAAQAHRSVITAVCRKYILIQSPVPIVQYPEGQLRTHLLEGEKELQLKLKLKFATKKEKKVRLLPQISAPRADPPPLNQAHHNTPLSNTLTTLQQTRTMASILPSQFHRSIP
jgi:hypothetical protein